mmetsp:Transcript_31756/g.69409  ORF Transcript_31756/g.69409 Transcript_31756/m.69409 type:complete len:271 (+) Transcript_31756:2181-2993(+)
MPSVSLDPSPNTICSVSRDAFASELKTPPLTFSARYMRKRSRSSSVRLPSWKAPPQRVTAPVPRATPSSSASAAMAALYASTSSRADTAPVTSRARVRPDDLSVSEATSTFASTRSRHIVCRVSFAMASSRPMRVWYSRALWSMARSAAAGSGKVERYFLNITSPFVLQASAICASLTLNSRFHGSRKRAFASPNTRLDRNTSFWNATRSCISASRPPTSERMRKMRRPTSMCASAASASCRFRASLKERRASASQPPRGTSPWPITLVR